MIREGKNLTNYQKHVFGVDSPFGANMGKSIINEDFT